MLPLHASTTVPRDGSNCAESNLASRSEGLDIYGRPRYSLLSKQRGVHSVWRKEPLGIVDEVTTCCIGEPSCERLQPKRVLPQHASSHHLRTRSQSSSLSRVKLPCPTLLFNVSYLCISRVGSGTSAQDYSKYMSRPAPGQQLQTKIPPQDSSGASLAFSVA